MSDYEVAVIGSGPGGYVAAIRAADLGLNVCVIEEKGLGGTCLTVGCIPTKTMIRSAEVMYLTAHASEYGVETSIPAVDWSAVIARKDKVVALLQRGVEGLFKKRGIDVVTGRGRLVAPDRIEVTAADGSRHRIEAAKVIVATGSVPVEVPTFPFDGRHILTSDDVTRLDRMPESILIVGGGYIGCEFACLFATLGVRVTVVEMLDHLLTDMDADLAKFALRILKRLRVDVRLGTRIRSIEAGGDGIAAVPDKGEAIEAEVALVSVGRRPAGADIGLEHVGVQLDERGAVPIDETCRTSVETIYAIGDVTGRMMLAHVASRQGIVAAEHAAGRPHARIDYGKVPAAVFLHPELAAVGMTESQARERVERVKVVNVPQQILGRAQAEGEPGGFVKIVADESTGEILGVHIAGHRASDFIHEAALAMTAELLVEDLAATVHAHPTFSEGLMEAANVWLDRGIHAG